MKSRCVKLYRAYSLSFNSSNVGKNLFLELNCKRLYQSSGKEKESRRLASSAKHKKKAFSRRSRAVTGTKYTKMRNARAELLFCQSKPITFLPFSLTSLSSLHIKLPNGPKSLSRPRLR